MKTGTEDPHWSALVESLCHEPGVTVGDPGRTSFGRSALKVDDKTFALVSSQGQIAIKLPKLRIDSLAAEGAGRRFEASGGRLMKRWMLVESASAPAWPQLAREALCFVRSLPPPNDPTGHRT